MEKEKYIHIADKVASMTMDRLRRPYMSNNSPCVKSNMSISEIITNI